MKILTEKVLASESVEGRPFKKIAKTLRGVVIVTDGSSKMKPKLSLKRASVEAFLIRLTKGFIFKFEQLYVILASILFLL